MSAIIFQNAQLITCTDQEPIENGYLITEGNLIKELGPGRPSVNANKYQTIDCGGGTLLPGLIDAHVHVGAFEPNLTEILRSYPTSYRIIRALEMMRLMMDQGYTTVRDCGGADSGIQRAINERRIPGPRLSISGPAISQTGGHADFRLSTEKHPPQNFEGGLSFAIADGVDECRKTCRELIRQGVDFLKIMGSGGAASPSDELDSAQYSPDEIKAICFEAENANKYVASHCYSDRAIIQSVENGVRTIEHGNLMTQEGAQVMLKHDAYLVPTLATYYEYAKRGEELGLPAVNITKIKAAQEKGLCGLEYAYKAGVKIGLGSDCLGQMQDSMALSLTLQAKVMGPMNAILAATRTNAKIIKQSDKIGSLEPGKLADIVVIKGDPLDDITLFENYHENIVVIMQDGAFYKNIL